MKTAKLSACPTCCQPAPLCKKCGKPAAIYNGYAGFSAHCDDCNSQMGKWRRASYARCKLRKAEEPKA